MRHVWALLAALGTVLIAGCVSDHSARSSINWTEKLRPFHSPSQPDVVLMEVVLLEQPIGDPYINEEVWNFADEQSLALERKSLLEDNGLRVGQIGGSTPARLQTLLTSEHSCANPRRVQLRAGTSRTLLIGPPAAQGRFTIHDDNEAVPVSVDQAEFALKVVPTLTKDGRTCLHCVPVVRHGDKRLQFCPAGEQANWILREDQPTENYSGLAWEITLAPNEYALVGARFDRVQTLGHQFFVRPDETVPVQRLLVIRTSRSSADKAHQNYLSPEEEDRTPSSPPLALQAALSGVPVGN